MLPGSKLSSKRQDCILNNLEFVRNIFVTFQPIDKKQQTFGYWENDVLIQPHKRAVFLWFESLHSTDQHQIIVCFVMT